MSKNEETGLKLGQDLPEHLLAKLKKTMEAHGQNVRANRVVYPDPKTVKKFDDVEPDFTFPSLTTPVVGPVDPAGFRGRDRRNRGGKNGGKSGGKTGGGKSKGGGGGGRPRSLPDPKMVHAEVAQMLSGIPLAGNEGNVQVIEQNFEFLDATKANYFQDALVEIVQRGHVIMASEVDAGGIAHLAKVSGYSGYCSTANTRAQAVGFLVHPRLKVLNVTEYSSIARVQGIPDLRPAFRLDLEDTVTGKKFSVVVLHLKSMRGGPKVTAVVRYKQFALLVQDLGPSFEGIVGGDLNYRIDDPTCNDADPMYQAGYVLVAKGDNSATHSMGGRIDGLFTKGMTFGVDYYRVVAYFTNAKLGRSLTDHATVTAEVLVQSTASNAAKGTGGGTATGGTDDTTDDTVHLVGGAKLPFLVPVGSRKKTVVAGGGRAPKRKPGGRR